LGVAVKLEEAGHRLRGANLLVYGEAPVGSGLSSSAAIEGVSGGQLAYPDLVSIIRSDWSGAETADTSTVGLDRSAMKLLEVYVDSGGLWAEDTVFCEACVGVIHETHIIQSHNSGFGAAQSPAKQRLRPAGRGSSCASKGDCHYD
jgi:hypothetical protein